MTFNGYLLSYGYLMWIVYTGPMAARDLTSPILFGLKDEENKCLCSQLKYNRKCVFIICVWVLLCVFSNHSVQMVSTLQLVLLMGVCLCGRWPQQEGTHISLSHSLSCALHLQLVPTIRG